MIVEATGGTHGTFTYQYDKQYAEYKHIQAAMLQGLYIYI